MLASGRAPEQCGRRRAERVPPPALALELGRPATSRTELTRTEPRSRLGSRPGRRNRRADRRCRGSSAPRRAEARTRAPKCRHALAHRPSSATGRNRLEPYGPNTPRPAPRPACPPEPGTGGRTTPRRLCAAPAWGHSRREPCRLVDDLAWVRGPPVVEIERYRLPCGIVTAALFL